MEAGETVWDKGAGLLGFEGERTGFKGPRVIQGWLAISKGDLAVRHYKIRKEKGFQGTHVISCKNTGSFQINKSRHIVYENIPTDAFQGPQDTGAASNFIIDGIDIPAATSGCRKEYQDNF